MTRMNFTITKCVTLAICNLMLIPLQRVESLFNDVSDLKLNVNIIYDVVDSKYAFDYGYSKPSHFITSKSGKLEMGFDYPQGLVKNSYRYHRNNITVNNGDFDTDMDFNNVTLNESLYKPYDIEIHVNSKFASHYYFRNNATKITDIQVDFEYLITRFIIKGMGIYSSYSNHIPGLVTTGFASTDAIVVGSSYERIVKEFQRPTIFDRHVLIKIQRSFIWQYYKSSLDLRNMEIKKSRWTWFKKFHIIGYDFASCLHRYVLLSQNLKYILDVDAYDGLILNDKRIDDEIVLDLLHEKYCDTVEFVLCANIIKGKIFEEMYEGVRIGPRVKRMLEVLGYKMK